MYHRFEENKYPSTNIRINNFKEHIKIIEQENMKFINPRDFENELLNNRSENFSYGLKLFLKLGFTERFKKDKNTIPYAMLLNNHNIIKDLNNFKLFMYSNGVENSIFYGEDAFFIPNHQGLSFADIDSIFKTVSVYLNKYNS